MSDSAAPVARVQVADFVRVRLWALTVWVAVGCWTVVLFSIVRDHYVHYRIGRYDLGNMVQAVWSTAHGRPLHMTDGFTGEQIVRFAYHVDPILALLAPLWVLAPSPLTILAVQVVAIAAGALPVFWLARRHAASEAVAALLAIGYLVYPWTAWAAIDVFHPLSLSLPLLLFAVWFLDGDRLVPFAVCAVLAAATGELVGLTIAALGVWYGLARGNRRAGAVIGVGGVLWSAIALLVVVPAFAGESSVYQGTVDGRVGGSPAGLVRTVFTDPLDVVAAATDGNDLAYLALIAIPLLGAFLLAPGLAAVAAPQLAINLLTNFGATTDPRAHYVAPILAALFAALAVGIGRREARRNARVVAAVLIATGAASIMLGPWSSASIGTPRWYQANSSAEAVAIRDAALSLVPADAAVSATNSLGAHLADRRYLVSAPRVGRAEWVVVDADDTWRPQAWGGVEDPEAIAGLIRRLDASDEWDTVFHRGRVLVFKRVGG